MLRSGRRRFQLARCIAWDPITARTDHGPLKRSSSTDDVLGLFNLNCSRSFKDLKGFVQQSRFWVPRNIKATILLFLCSLGFFLVLNNQWRAARRIPSSLKSLNVCHIQLHLLNPPTSQSTPYHTDNGTPGSGMNAVSNINLSSRCMHGDV